MVAFKHLFPKETAILTFSVGKSSDFARFCEQAAKVDETILPKGHRFCIITMANGQTFFLYDTDDHNYSFFGEIEIM